MSPAIGGDIGMAVKVPVRYKHVIGRTWACPRARQDKTGQDRTGQDRHTDIKTHRHTLPTDTPTHRHTRTRTHTHTQACTHTFKNTFCHSLHSSYPNPWGAKGRRLHTLNLGEPSNGSNI